MKKLNFNYFLAFVMLCFSVTAFSQNTTAQDSLSKFNKYKAFSPLFMTEMANSFNSATGQPGPNYWQNRADYDIKATLDTVQHKVQGQVIITYTNNSPYSLDYLWLQMDQNAFRNDSKSKALYPAGDRNGVRTPTSGYELSSVKINGKTADYIVSDTRMQIRLDQSLKARGDQSTIQIDYAYTIPTHGKDRTGRVETENGVIYTIAQWFPRMAVFDETEGWNNLPYLGTGEFYLEYGDYHYQITAPENMLIVGSGVLQNPKNVLTKTQRDRLDKAQKSEETVMILSKEEMLEGTHHAKGKKGMLTWEFKMNNARDVAWAASKAFIWDAARINLPSGKKALAQSVYPAENSDQDGYGRSTEYTKHAIEINSQWYEYPYEVATNVGAHEGGMEYPGLVFCSYKSKNSSLWGVINHEFGHTWFPMIVGSNERVYAWLDEGLNTFINDIATEQFNDGEYNEEQDFQNMGGFMFNASWDPLFTRADVIHNQQKLGIEAYYKPAIALHVLRNVVLGEDRFDYALKQYIKKWAYKHAQPWDFFNAMNNASGEDLGWFFKSWFMENWSHDQEVKGVEYVDGDSQKGAKITLVNKGEMPMPVDLKVTYEDESTHRVQLPVEIWMTGAEYTYHIEDSTKKIKQVEIDPDHLTPDANPGNNTFKNLIPAPEGVSVDAVIDTYLDAVGGRDNLEGIKDMYKETKTKMQGMELTISEYAQKPGKYAQEIKVFGNTVQKIVVNGDEVAVYAQGQKQEISDEQEEGLKLLAEEDQIELKHGSNAYSFNLLGVDQVEGQSAYVVEISTPHGETLKNYYHTGNGLKLLEKDSNGGSASYSDYREVDGIKIPFQTQKISSGQKMDGEVIKILINKGIDDNVFK